MPFFVVGRGSFLLLFFSDFQNVFMAVDSCSLVICTCQHYYLHKLINDPEYYQLKRTLSMLSKDVACFVSIIIYAIL